MSGPAPRLPAGPSLEEAAAQPPLRSSGPRKGLRID